MVNSGGSPRLLCAKREEKCRGDLRKIGKIVASYRRWRWIHVGQADRTLDSGQHEFHKRRIAHQHRHMAIKVNFGRSTRSLRNAFDDLANTPLNSLLYFVVKNPDRPVNLGQIGDDIGTHARVDHRYTQYSGIVGREIPRANRLQVHNRFRRHDNWVNRLLRPSCMRLLSVKCDVEVSN